jgi:large conductance mechanosensitive channel
VDIGFNIGDPPPPGEGAGGGNKDVSIGMIIDAAISFLVVAFFLFLAIKAYNRYMLKPEEEPAALTEVELLTEIRDALQPRPTP